MNAHTVSHSLLEAETVLLSLEDKELICLVHLQVFAFCSQDEFCHDGIVNICYKVAAPLQPEYLT